MLIQANFDVKPFLDYILQNNDFDKEDLLQLKRKVALLKSKQTKKNMSILSGRKDDVEKIMQAHRERLRANIDINQFMEAIADNVEFEEISQILDNQNNQQLIERINDVINNSDEK